MLSTSLVHKKVLGVKRKRIFKPSRKSSLYVEIETIGSGAKGNVSMAVIKSDDGVLSTVGVHSWAFKADVFVSRKPQCCGAY